MNRPWLSFFVAVILPAAAVETARGQDVVEESPPVAVQVPSASAPSSPAGAAPSAVQAPRPASPRSGTPAPAAPGTQARPRVTPPRTTPPPTPESMTAPSALPPAASPAPASTTPGARFAGLGGSLGGGGGFLNMLGDQAPLTHILQIPTLPPAPPGLPPPTTPPVPGRPGGASIKSAALVPSVRGFKVSENQSPQPQDRIYYSFNYYNNLNAAINQRLGSPITGMNVYREILGFEKTFQDGQGSIGMRLPIDTLSAGSTIRGLGGTSTAVGDLAIILKYAFLWNRDTGSLFSGGLLVSAPTGPNNFAGFRNITSPHNAALQPWVGFIYNLGDFYFHGFSAIDVPTNPNDVTIWYNDLGVGYYLYRAAEPNRVISVIAPTFEVHVNSPLNHSNPFNFNDPAGTPDIVDLTFGINVGVGKRGLLSVGYVDPVTGPRPFNGELLALFNIRF